MLFTYFTIALIDITSGTYKTWGNFETARECAAQSEVLRVALEASVAQMKHSGKMPKNVKVSDKIRMQCRMVTDVLEAE